VYRGERLEGGKSACQGRSPLTRGASVLHRSVGRGIGWVPRRMPWSRSRSDWRCREVDGFGVARENVSRAVQGGVVGARGTVEVLR
jgi:hypothetical protein